MRHLPLQPCDVDHRALPGEDIGAAARAHFILGLVAVAFGVAPTEILSRARRPPVVFARQIAIYLFHSVFRAGARRAGCAFGRDRNTARHAFRVVEEARENPYVDERIGACEHFLRGVTGMDPEAPEGAPRFAALMIAEERAQ